MPCRPPHSGALLSACQPCSDVRASGGAMARCMSHSRHTSSQPHTRTWCRRWRSDAREQDADTLNHRQQHAAKHRRLARRPQPCAQLQETACTGGQRRCGAKGRHARTHRQSAPRKSEWLLACYPPCHAPQQRSRCTRASCFAVLLGPSATHSLAGSTPRLRTGGSSGVHTRQCASCNAVPWILLLAQRHQRAVKGAEEAAPDRKAAADARRLSPNSLQQAGHVHWHTV